jgi:CHAT domain-containing protein
MSSEGSNVVEQLEELAKKHGMGFLLLEADDGSYAFQISNPGGVHAIDLSAPDLMQTLRRHVIFAGPQVSPDLISAAQEAATLGVKERGEGHVEKALFFYRFSLFVASHIKNSDGIDALTKNIWILREVIKDELPPEGSLHSQEDHPLRALLKLIEADGRELHNLLTTQRDELLAATDEQPDVEMMLGLRRIADFAGESDWSLKILKALAATAARSEQWEYILKGAVEHLAQANLLDALGAAGVLDGHGSELAEVWNLYASFQNRLRLLADEGDLVQFFGAAFRHFERIRLQATTAGGAFGHRSSYIISQFLQPIGRDYVWLLMKAGFVTEALSVAEQTHARSMVDWMSRTHMHNRIPRYFTSPMRLTGSVNAVEPASLKEMYEASVSVQAPILRYLSVQNGYEVWLQKKDGTVIPAYIENPDRLLKKVFERLTYSQISRAPERDLGRSRNLRPHQVQVSDEKLLNEDLGELYRLLFPPEIRKELETEGERLVIITDSLLDYVPFCTLVAEDGRYLVQKHEIIYWPSVTAWLLIDGACKVRKRRRQAGPSAGDAANAGPGALLIGNPSFSIPYEALFEEQVVKVSLTPLPGTQHEVEAIGELLHVTPRLGDAATKAILFRTGEDIRIIHLATHGMMNESHPEDSFLAFSDGFLTANALYQYDPGIRVDLVMLSACQTGLGQAHPDSSIGISNAFHIAGASTVGATLWQISDEVTVRLMIRFYKELLGGENVAAALRKAQLDILQEPRLNHPYFWGAFKISGSLETIVPTTHQ